MNGQSKFSMFDAEGNSIWMNENGVFLKLVGKHNSQGRKIFSRQSNIIMKFCPAKNIFRKTNSFAMSRVALELLKMLGFTTIHCSVEGYGAVYLDIDTIFEKGTLDKLGRFEEQVFFPLSEFKGQ